MDIVSVLTKLYCKSLLLLFLYQLSLSQVDGFVVLHSDEDVQLIKQILQKKLK